MLTLCWFVIFLGLLFSWSLSFVLCFVVCSQFLLCFLHFQHFRQGRWMSELITPMTEQQKYSDISDGSMSLTCSTGCCQLVRDSAFCKQILYCIRPSSAKGRNSKNSQDYRCGENWFSSGFLWITFLFLLCSFVDQVIFNQN